MRAERDYLRMLVESNPARLELVSDWRREGPADQVAVRLLASPAYLLEGGVARVHDVRLVFPEYFPAMSTEAWLARPVLHPNVHPANGFICLWQQHSPHYTVVETVLQVERVIGWRLWNGNPEHVMQDGIAHMPPFDDPPLRVPADYYRKRAEAGAPGGDFRRRLSLPSE